MPQNHLEQLVGEWYEYSGYFVRRNVRVKGGELDRVGFHPKSRHFVRVESGCDTDAWPTREARYAKKFAAGRVAGPRLFDGLPVPGQPEPIAIQYEANKGMNSLGGGRLVLLKDLLREIMDDLARKSFERESVPGAFPVLRTIQAVLHYHGSAVETSGPNRALVSGQL